MYPRVKLGLGDDGTAVDAVGGAGAAGTNTQRVVLASDDPGVTILTALQKAEDAAHSSGDKGVQLLTVRADTAAATSGTDGDYQPLVTDSTGRLWCNVSNTVTVASHAVTNAGTFAVQATGTVADDATTPGNPVMVGGKAVETDGTDPSSVSAEDDVAIFRTDRNRRLLVNDFHPNFWTLFENHTSAQTNNQLKAAPGANLSLYITDLIISNGATAGTIYLVEDEGGTPVQKTQTLYLAVNGGAALHFRTPLRLTANKTLGFTSATMTTHSIEVHGFTAP